MLPHYITCRLEDDTAIDEYQSSTNSSAGVAISFIQGLRRSQEVVCYTSVGAAFVTFIGIIIYHFVILVKKTEVWINRIQPQLVNMTLSLISSKRNEAELDASLVESQDIPIEERQNFQKVNYTEA